MNNPHNQRQELRNRPLLRRFAGSFVYPRLTLDIPADGWPMELLLRGLDQVVRDWAISLVTRAVDAGQIALGQLNAGISGPMRYLRSVAERPGYQVHLSSARQNDTNTTPEMNKWRRIR